MDHKQKAHNLLRELKDDPVQPLSTLLRHELAERIAEATAEAEVTGFQTANLQVPAATDPEKDELQIQLVATTARVTYLEDGYGMIVSALHKGEVSTTGLLDFCQNMITKDK